MKDNTLTLGVKKRGIQKKSNSMCIKVHSDVFDRLKDLSYKTNINITKLSSKLIKHSLNNYVIKELKK